MDESLLTTHMNELSKDFSICTEQIEASVILSCQLYPGRSYEVLLVRPLDSQISFPFTVYVVYILLSEIILVALASDIMSFLTYLCNSKWINLVN